jgi:DNA polymerase III subunit delta'
MAPRSLQTWPESDRFEGTPHPRETHGFFGNPEAERALLLAYFAGRLPHALMLCGPPGIGKATLAWRLARFLLANPEPNLVLQAERRDLFIPESHLVSHQIAALSHPDLVLLRREWNPDTKKHRTQIQVDDVRRAIHMFQQSAGFGGFRICVVDCADDLNSESANALLKIVEEPPPCSLFLLVAHQPGRLPATLRSRCRKIQLNPLGPEDIGNVLAALGPLWQDASEDARESAKSRTQGSIRRALRLLDGEERSFDIALASLLDELPQIEWNKVYILAGRITADSNGKDYDSALALIDEWLDKKVRVGALDLEGHCARRLAPYAEVWEKLAAAARETEIYNLDKRAFVVSLFADLAAASRASSY